MDKSDPPFLTEGDNNARTRAAWKVLVGGLLCGGLLVASIFEIQRRVPKAPIAALESVYSLTAIGPEAPGDHELIEVADGHAYWHLLPQREDFGAVGLGATFHILNASGQYPSAIVSLNFHTRVCLCVLKYVLSPLVVCDACMMFSICQARVKIP